MSKSERSAPADPAVLGPVQRMVGRVAAGTRPLFVPLRTEFFEAFASGAKTVEFRRYGARWNERTCQPGRAVVLSLGYGKKRRLSGVVTWFKVSQHHATEAGFVACYGQDAGPAACIGIELCEAPNDKFTGPRVGHRSSDEHN